MPDIVMGLLTILGYLAVRAILLEIDNNLHTEYHEWWDPNVKTWYQVNTGIPSVHVRYGLDEPLGTSTISVEEGRKLFEATYREIFSVERE